jgi:YesN/AraC family two-component response regulator
MKRPEIILFNNIDAIQQYTFPRKLESVLVVVCTKGNVHIDVDLRMMTLEANDLMVLRPGHIINSYNVSKDFLGYSLITDIENFAPVPGTMAQMLNCFMYYQHNPVVKLSREQLKTQLMLRNMLNAKIGSRTDEDGTQLPMADKVIESLTQTIFYETLSIYLQQMDNSEQNYTSRSDELFYQFVNLVEKNFKEERLVSNYAKKLCITAKHLSAVVKNVSGQSPTDIINSYVILDAKISLTTTDMTIQEISARLHFPNQSFFGRYFKQHTGLSPRQYRKNQQV